MGIKCGSCGKNTHLLEFKCSICQIIFCTKCRLPEDHLCCGLDKFKADKTLLIQKLNKEATKDNHNNLNKIQ